MVRAHETLSRFRAIAKPLLLLHEDLRIADVTESFLSARCLQRDDVLGRPVCEVFPAAVAGTELCERQGAGLLTLRDLFERVSGCMCLTCGPQHVVEFIQQSSDAHAGHCIAIGMPIGQAWPEAASAEFIGLLDKVYASGCPATGSGCKLKVQPRAGAVLTDAWFDFICQPVLSADGKVAGLLVCGHDVSNEIQARQALHSIEERFHLALEAAGDGVWDWNIPEDRFMFSARGRAMLGYGEDEVGSRMEDWLAITHPDDQERLQTNTMACLKGRLPFFSAEYRVRCQDGSWKWLLSRGAVIQRDRQGRAIRMVGTTIDISTEQETLRRANFDSLTRLPNRNLFRDRLGKEMQGVTRTDRSLALLFIDLDRFKEVNDLLGHDAGDKLLRQCADRICSCVRAADTVARLGGDEFTVILSDLEGRAHVEDIVQKILDELSRPFVLGDAHVHISASIGITLYPDDGNDQERLLQNADQAMYVAKNSGRNQFHFFTRSMQEQAWHRITMLADLRNALPRDEMRLHFQPVIEFASGKLVKAEALLRWQHPRKGLLLPSAFITIAEEGGLIHELGNWAFMQSLDWSSRWGALTGAPFQIGVNASPIQFMQHKQAMNWGRKLNDSSMPSSCISVEITEGVLFNTSSVTEQQLLEMRGAGIEVAIDDFGTGFSSMAYLKKLDVDYLKIDQSFVRGTTHDNHSRVIAETIIVMAHKLGLKVIAEGIETPEQQDWLRQAGCDYGQGFLFSRPLPAEQFELLLRGGATFASSPALDHP